MIYDSIIVTGSAQVSGSLSVTGGITGSLQGTASYAVTASYSFNAVSASYALTASYLTGYVSPFPYTGSAIISGSLIVTGSTTSTLGFTGSLSGTASYATTASYANNSTSASYALTASYSHNSTSASYAITASYSNNSTSASYAVTASYSNNSTSASYALTASYVSSNFQYEVHVSQVDGNDTTGDGSLLKPVASITKALTLITGQRRTIIIHPGSYTESPSITTQYTVLTTFEPMGGNTAIIGTVSTSVGCTIAGLAIDNLTITAGTGVGVPNIINCNISGTLTKSGNATFTDIHNCDIGTACNITGTGLVTINDGNPNFVTVNNAGANVIIKNAMSCVAPSVTAGTLNITDSVVIAAVTNAVTSNASSIVTLANSQFLTSALNAVAPVSLSGFYSIFNCVFDKPNSTLVALSGTGGSTNSVDYFQYIDADNITTKGLTVTGSINVSGSVINTLTSSFAVSASQATSASYAITASYANNSTSASYAVTASYSDTSTSASYALSASYANNATTSQTASYILNAVSASYAITASYSNTSTSASYAISASHADSSISASYALSASYANNATTSQTASYVLNAVSASYALTASYANNSTTASYAITASYADSATSASYSLTASYANIATNAQTASYVLNAVSASYALTASYANTSTSASYSTTASYALTASSADDFLVRGTLTAQTIVVQTITSSIDFVTGSTRFGSLIDNTHVFTGSISVSGSITVGNDVINNLTASNATSASYANNATSASYALTASYANNSTSASYTNNSTSASYSNSSTSASYALTASHAINGGVTQILAGANVTIAPTNGQGQVTISATGGGGSNFNTATGSYGSFYDTTTQTNVAGTARSMSFNTTDITNGVSISGSTNPFNTYIKTENAGVYDIQFSAQVDKTDSGTDEIWIWLRKNGTNLTDTATSIQLVGNGAHYVAAWNFFVNSAANDYYQLMWYSPDANVRLHAEPGFGVVPGIPSVIATVNRVDQFLSNTGSFSGSFNGNFTGSLFGTSSYANNSTSASYAVTASYANNSTSASYAITASYANNATNAQTASYVLNAISASYSNNSTSASYALTASYLTGYVSPFPYTGSALITGSLGVTGSISIQGSGSNLFAVDGTLGRMFTIDDTVSGSLLSVNTGSLAILEVFSDKKINMSGSVTITGSLNVITSITGSLFGTSSYAITASYALNSTPSVPSTSVRNIQKFTATSGQTSFTISGGYNVGLVDVYINGVKLDNSGDFTATNGTTVVLTVGAMLNDIVEVYNYVSAFTANNTLRVVTPFTATAAQTTFTVDYTPGFVDVFYNGSKLAASEYTSSNGTTIVLGTAAQLNDIIEVIAYSYTVGAFTGIGGSGTANYVAKFISGSTIATSSIYDSGSNVGINTINPIYTLDVSGSARFTNTATITGSLSVSGSNTLIGTKTITGSVFISGSKTVIGTNTITGSLNVSGSSTIIGTTVLSGSLTVSGSITSNGTLTAQTLVVQTITSSVLYSSGSNVFGNSLSNTQTFTGSVGITGSVAIIPSAFTVGSATAVDANSLTIQSANSNYLLRFKSAANVSLGGFYYDGTNFIADGPSWKFGNAAIFNSSVSIGGYLTGTGVNPGGLGGSRYLIDFSGNYSRFFSYGINNATNGAFLFNSQRSDGTNSIDFLTIASTGAATFSSSVTAVGTGLQPIIHAKGGGDATGQGKGNFRSSDGGGANYFDFGRDNLTTGNFVLTSGGGSPLLSITTGGAATFSSSVTAGGDLVSNGGVGTTRFIVTSAGAGDALGILYNASSVAKIQLYTNGVSYFNGGNVGIGTTSPSIKLQVVESGANWVADFKNYGSGAYGVRIDLSGSTGTAGAYAFRIYTQTNDGFYLLNNGAFYAQGVYNYSSTGGTQVNVDSGGNLFRFTSSQRYKREINNYTKGLSDLLNIQPKSFKSKNPKEGEKVFAGLIAEQIDEIGLTEFVEYNDEGQPDAVHYSAMTALLVKAIQELKAENDTLKDTLQRNNII